MNKVYRACIDAVTEIIYYVVEENSVIFIRNRKLRYEEVQKVKENEHTKYRTYQQNIWGESGF